MDLTYRIIEVIVIRPIRYRETLIAKVDSTTRRVVEALAYDNRTSMSDVTRELLEEAIRARGLTA